MRATFGDHAIHAVVFLVALLIAVAAAEVAAQYRGIRPTARSPEVMGVEWGAFDSELGWTNRPNARVSWGGGIASFLMDGSRRTAANPIQSIRNRWLLLGCSYTQGFGLADADTFGWQLQARFPDIELRNFGTGGYSTYQSLLRFRRERTTRPALVVYGFGDFQGYRDLASRAWMHSAGDAMPFVPPHVAVQGDQLVEYPLRWLPTFPLERYSALSHLAAVAYFHRFVYAPDIGLVAAQRAVLQRMRDEVVAEGARLLVANLWTDPNERTDWRAWFASERFDVADCLTPDMPFDHPDREWSRHHARCIGDAIDTLASEVR
jgi:hypothetical protein